MRTATDLPSRVSVSVWLPVSAHEQLRERAQGASLPVLARSSAAVGVAAPGGRVAMTAPDGAVVERLRAAGYRLNGLVAALNEGLAGTATIAQYRALAARIVPLLEEVADIADAVQLRPPLHRSLVGSDNGDGWGWKMVRVTTDPDTQARWQRVTQVSGFRSVANWVRDAIAGVHGLAIPRPPALATMEARSVVGRVTGLVAQVQLAADQVAVVDRVCGGRAESAGTFLAVALDSLVSYGGDVKARR